MSTTCVLDDCSAPAGVPGSARGMCRSHYLKARATERGACSVAGCEALVRARDLCVRHLTRVSRTGRIDLPSRAEKFWQQVVIAGHADCWTWTGLLGSKGYGRFTPDRDMDTTAHRFAYEALVGPIPDGLQLDHLCRVRTCVNPAHLEPVTLAENVRREHLARRPA